jgi:hypothetical protein
VSGPLPLIFRRIFERVEGGTHVSIGFKAKTLDTYGHLMPGIQNEASDLMDELVTPVEIKLHQIAPKLHRDENIP